MNILDNLNAHLSILKDSNKGWEFFVSLKDYVNFINGSSDFKKITEDLKEPREVLTKERTALENKSVVELTGSLSIIRTIVSKNGLNKNLKIGKVLSDIDNYMNPNGGLQISGNVSDNLERFLFEICQNVPEEERFILFEQFIDKNPKYNNIYGNFSFSKTIEARRDMDSRIEHRDSHELWSDWLKLDQVPKFIEAYSINGIELTELDCKFGYDLINARSFYDSEPEYNDDRDIKFTKLIPNYRNSAEKIHAYISRKVTKDEPKATINEYKRLKSIHLVTEALEPRSVIFLVLDEHYEIPTECKVNNNKGRPAYIKRLYDLAYPVNVEGKSVPYDEILSDSINNGLFRLRPVALYMKANGLHKPTLVKKSEDGNNLVLKNETTIKTALIKNIPPQFQYLYINKTK